MEVDNNNNNEIGGNEADPFARSGLQRSPPQQSQSAEKQQQLLINSELQDHQQREQARNDQQPLTVTTESPKKSKVEAAKKLVDELHEFADKRNNVHKDIKGMVIKIRGLLRSAVKEWETMAQRIAIVEGELVAIKNAQSATAAVPLQVGTGIFPRKHSDKGAPGKGEGSGTPKRTRSSPGELRLDPPKKKKGDLGNRLRTAEGKHEKSTGVENGTPWRLVSRNEKRNKRNKSQQRLLTRDKKKGEALILKTNEETYAEVLQNLRTNPALAELKDDVERIRRTRTGDRLVELKKDAKKHSSSYTQLIEQAMGERVQVKAKCPEVTLQIKDMDEITTPEEVKAALLDKCGFGEIDISIRMRKGPCGTQAASIKLPVDAAGKALEIGKIRVGVVICRLSISQRPDVCFKCQGYGHMSWNCKGPDRSNLCRRCGEIGHKAQTCSKPAKCLICASGARNDHVTGGPRCQAFKEAMAAKSRWR